MAADPVDADFEAGSRLHGLFADVRVLWLAFFGSSCLGLDQLVPIEAVACLDAGVDYEQYTAQTGTRFLSAERLGVQRHDWLGCSADAGFEQRAPALRQLLTSPGKPWLVLSGHASPAVEILCAELGCAWAGPSATTTQQLEHKAALDRALRAARLPRIPRRWLSLADTSWPQLSSELGAPCVLQTACSSAGRGTRLLRSAEDFAHAQRSLANEQVSAAPLIGRLALNINAAVVAGQPLVGFPNLQLVGESALACPWGGYAGNDFSAAAQLDAGLLHELQEQTARLGSQLASEGFDGLFGLDFVIAEADGRPYAIDLNPRWQGSTALACQAELWAGRTPLAAIVLAWQAGRLAASEVFRLAGGSRQALHGAQMQLRVPDAPTVPAAKAVEPGLYRFGPQARLLGKAARLGQLASDQWLLQKGIPRAGTTLVPGAWLARLSRSSAVVDAQGQLLADARQAASEVYRLFGLAHLLA